MIFEDSNHPFGLHTRFDEHHTMLENAFAQHAQLDHRDEIRNPEMLERQASDDPLDPFHSSLGTRTSPEATGKVLTWASTREDIIVTGVRQTQNSDDGGGYDGTGSYGDSGGIGSPGGSGGGGGYATPSASIAANAFADAHVHNSGTTAADAKEYERVHDDLAKLYDYAAAHPDQLVDIGKGVYIPLSEIMTDLGKDSFIITDNATLAGTSGAVTVTGSSPGSLTTYIDPQNAGAVTYNSYTAGSGTDYQIFHEIGHVADYFSSPAQATLEGSANTAGASIETALGIPLMNINGNPITPTGNYNP